MRQVIDEFVLVQRGEAAERINGTMILSDHSYNLHIFLLCLSLSITIC